MASFGRRTIGSGIRTGGELENSVNFFLVGQGACGVISVEGAGEDLFARGESL